MKILFIHQFFTLSDEPGESRHIEFMKYMPEFSFDVVGGSLNYLTGKNFPGFKGLWQSKKTSRENHALTRVALTRVYVPETYRNGFWGRIACYLSYLIFSVICSFKFPKPDIVLTTSPSLFTALAGYIISRIKRVPFYLEIRDLWPKAAVETGMLKNKKIIDLSYKLEKFLCSKAEKIIVITTGYADYIKSLGIDEKKIYVIPNGVDYDVLEYKRGEMPKDISECKDKFTVMYAGAVSNFNHLDKLIVIAEKLKSEKDIIFVIVGDGNQKENLARLVKEKKLNNVILTGFKTKDEISAYLARANICVNFYPFIDTARLLLQNKVLDYMAMGKPVLLQAPEGVTADIIKDADCGFMLGEDPDDFAHGIKWCRDNPNACVPMGLRGKVYIRSNYLRQDLAKKFAEVLSR